MTRLVRQVHCVLFFLSHDDSTPAQRSPCLHPYSAHTGQYLCAVHSIRTHMYTLYSLTNVESGLQPGMAMAMSQSTISVELCRREATEMHWPGS